MVKRLMEMDEATPSATAKPLGYCIVCERGGEATPAEGGKPGWIPVSERLPENTNNVLAYYVNSHGHGRRILAFYARQHQIEDDSDAGMDDAEEHEGTVYIPSGWYESNEADEYYYRADGQVSHWQELPSGPGQSK